MEPQEEKSGVPYRKVKENETEQVFFLTLTSINSREKAVCEVENCRKIISTFTIAGFQ